VWTLGADGRPAEICRGDVPHVPPYITKDSVSLDGARLARSGCADTPGILISDLNSPGAPAVGIAPDGGPVRIAGDFVAWRTDQGFEVLNRATGAQTALSLEHAPLPAPVDDFDVAPDGTLAVIGGVGPDESSPFAGWASPSDPSWHAFGVAGLRNVGVHVRGGRIAVLVGVPERRRVEVRLLDLAGGQTTAAVGNDPRLGLSPFYSEAIPAGFDFDGTSVAWATRACGSLVVMVTPVGAGTATGPSPGGCAVLVSPASVTVRNRVAKVALRCPAPAVPQRSDRCAGALRASLARHGHAAPVRFSVPPDAARDVRLKLPARWSRLLARRHRLRITVQARSATRGHVSLTRAPVTLRAR
jgi:hypothetical protein